MIAWVPWVDLKGYTLGSTFYADGVTGLSNILDAIAPLSNAYATPWYASAVQTPPAPGTPAGGYPDVGTVADLTFKSSSDGSSLHLWVPAPGNIFYGDLETVDPSLISSLIGVVLANAVTPNGVPLDTYVQGYRRQLTRRNYR